MNLKNWLNAFRLPFLTASIIPVVLGSAIAWHNIDKLNWPIFWLTLLGVCFLHIGTNLTNDFFDHKTKNDDLNLNPTPVSGGSRLIQNGILSAKSILLAAIISFSLGSIIGLYLVWLLKSEVILFLGIIGVFLGFFYTAFPLKIGYRGFGELIVGLCFGPLIVFGSYFVQVKQFSSIPIFASIPISVLISLVLLINEFPDFAADKAVNKKTLVVNLGKEKTVALYHILLGFVYLYTLICILIRILPFYSLLTAITIPFALRAYSISKEHFRNIDKLLPACYLTINLHLIYGLLLSLSFILANLF